MIERVALITGGARGIGRGIALDLAANDWRVALCYRTSQQEAEEVNGTIEGQGGKALAIQCDVSDPTAATQLVQHVEGTWGRIDALINGAGPYHRVSLFEETVEGWSEMFTNNLHPIFYLAKAVAPGNEDQKIWPDHFVQHGQRGQNGSPTACDRPLYCQGRRAHSYQDPGKNIGSGWYHRECDFTRIHRFRKRAAWRVGRDSQKNTGRIYRGSRRYRSGRPLFSF